ncbi:PREDICTED: uncharacterized protein LOC101309919 [Fragaria vesca subsp. vesca]
MPFGLKNAGATYQRLVNAMFEEEIGEVMEVYVDDMLVKSKTNDGHIANLDKVFTKLLAHGMRLNPQKCILAVGGGNFLGVPLLSKPILGEVLYLYLVVSATAISAALTRHEHNNELPVYYYGRGFADPETRYPNIEKLALALITTARKLRQYFQAHTIHVLTNHPLRQILQKPETSGRMVKWAIELGEFDIHFKPRTAIKGQAAADFIAEFIPLDHGNPNDDAPPRDSIWELHVDGSSNNRLNGARIIITDLEGHSYEYALRFEFKESNNIAEYEALVAGIQLC